MTITQMAQSNFAYRNMYINQLGAAKSLRNLSSGLRVNNAADDSAGLSISEGMRGQISGLSNAYTNSQNAISLVQTAEGHLNQTSSILIRMKELATSASTGTMTDEERELSNVEFTNLQEELNRISNTSEYNGVRLLDGSLGGKQGQAGMLSLGITGVSAAQGSDYHGDVKFSIDKNEDGQYSMTAHIGDKAYTNLVDGEAIANGRITFEIDGGKINVDFKPGDLKEGVISGVGMRGSNQVNVSRAVSNAKTNGIAFQIGANGSADQRVEFRVNDMSAFGLGLGDANISTLEGAVGAVKAIDKAIEAVADERGGMGAMHNRLEHTLNNLGVSQDRLVEAESTIRDADMAKEMMDYMQKSFLAQSAQAVMSQGMNMTRQLMLSMLSL